MFDVSSRAKLSVSAPAERKIASARPRKYGLLLRAEEEMLLYGQALASLKVKFADFELISRSRTLAGAVSSHDELENVSAELLKAIFPTEKAVRLLGVSISGFAPTQMDTPSQIALL